MVLIGLRHAFSSLNRFCILGATMCAPCCGGDNLCNSVTNTGSTQHKIRPVVTINASILEETKNADGVWQIKQ